MHFPAAAATKLLLSRLIKTALSLPKQHYRIPAFLPFFYDKGSARAHMRPHDPLYPERGWWEGVRGVILSQVSGTGTCVLFPLLNVVRYFCPF